MENTAIITRRKFQTNKTYISSWDTEQIIIKRKRALARGSQALCSVDDPGVGEKIYCANLEATKFYPSIRGVFKGVPWPAIHNEAEEKNGEKVNVSAT